jgi:ubiquinone/menaquinone biosynthesis C-methylase UbiE
MTLRNKYLKIFLEKLPFFQAVFRAVEAEALADYELADPILDLGCGDGVFAEVFLGKEREIVGVDLNQRDLAQAKKKAVYQRLVRADARSLPFTSGRFNTVFSNSVFEHIKDLRPVLHEAYRVLAKGGVLVLTAPSEKRKQLFSGYRFLAGLKMPGLASRLGAWENQLFNHVHCWSGKKWRQELVKVGFSKVEYQYCGSPRTALISDFFLPLAFVGSLERKIFKRYLPWRKYFAPLFFLFLRNFEDKIKSEKGAVIVVKAGKK